MPEQKIPSQKWGRQCQSLSTSLYAEQEQEGAFSAGHSSIEFLSFPLPPNWKQKNGEETELLPSSFCLGSVPAVPAAAVCKINKLSAAWWWQVAWEASGCVVGQAVAEGGGVQALVVGPESR